MNIAPLLGEKILVLNSRIRGRALCCADASGDGSFPFPCLEALLSGARCAGLCQHDAVSG